jgi:hypothetical protein
VDCPLPAGGAVIHHSRTLHSAGPNGSAQPRLAYVLAFRGPLRESVEFRGYAWNQAKQTAAQKRAQQWRNRGGPAGRLFRKCVLASRQLVLRCWRRAGRCFGGA